MQSAQVNVCPILYSMPQVRLQMVRFEDVARGADAVLDSEIKKLVYAGETFQTCAAGTTSHGEDLPKRAET